jgi:hypothetical protein
LKPAKWTTTEGLPGAHPVEGATGGGSANAVVAAERAAPPTAKEIADFGMIFPTASL